MRCEALTCISSLGSDWVWIFVELGLANVEIPCQMSEIKKKRNIFTLFSISNLNHNKKIKKYFCHPKETSQEIRLLVCNCW